MYINIVMSIRIFEDQTLQLLKEQYNLSKKLYFDYLLNLIPKYWRNIYVKILLTNNKFNNRILNLNNIFRKIKPKLSSSIEKKIEKKISLTKSSKKKIGLTKSSKLNKCDNIGKKIEDKDLTKSSKLYEKEVVNYINYWKFNTKNKSNNNNIDLFKKNKKIIKKLARRYEISKLQKKI